MFRNNYNSEFYKLSSNRYNLKSTDSFILNMETSDTKDFIVDVNYEINDTNHVPLEWMSYRSMVKYAMSIGLPGNFKRQEYIQLLRLHGMGLDFECKQLAQTMKTNRQIMKKSIPKKCIDKKRSVGRPRKQNVEEELSEISSENASTRASVITRKPDHNIHMLQTKKIKKPNSEIQMSSSNNLTVNNIVKFSPPIAKTTSDLLRSKLLSPDRIKFNNSTNINTITSNNTYYKYYQTKWKNNNKILNTQEEEINSTVNNYLPNIQIFPDIPQLADVDYNASFEQDNYSVNDQTDNDATLCIDDSDTISNQSTENVEREQQDFDQRWAMSLRLDNGEMINNCEAFNSLDEGFLLGPQDSTSVQNDLIQNYIETNDVNFMQLPDSSGEVIRTLQYYESASINPRPFPEHNLNGSISNEQIEPDVQLNLMEGNQIEEFANMIPCPVAGCLWYSGSSTLYVHLFSCHQEMIYYGSSITHVFKCQDIQNFCFYTHLQYIQSTIYIITVSFDEYTRTFVATIQHVSSSNNTSASSTTAILTTKSFYNNDDHSWVGQVQPYSVPLDLLHSDGKCLFIDPINSYENLIINVNLTLPLSSSNDSMLACL